MPLHTKHSAGWSSTWWLRMSVFIALYVGFHCVCKCRSLSCILANCCFLCHRRVLGLIVLSPGGPGRPLLPPINNRASIVGSTTEANGAERLLLPWSLCCGRDGSTKVFVCVCDPPRLSIRDAMLMVMMVMMAYGDHDDHDVNANANGPSTT